MNYQKLILAGNVTANAKRQKSKKSDVTYTTFSVAVSGEKDDPVFFPIVMFGKLGEKLTRYITKGRGVLVEGRVRLSQQGRLGVIADQIRLGASRPKAKKAKA